MKSTNLQEDKHSIIELDEWVQMQREGALLALFKILHKHHDYCNKQALQHLSNKRFEEAMCWQAKAADQEAIVALINNRINALKKEVR